MSMRYYYKCRALELLHSVICHSTSKIVSIQLKFSKPSTRRISIEYEYIILCYKQRVRICLENIARLLFEIMITFDSYNYNYFVAISNCICLQYASF